MRKGTDLITLDMLEKLGACDEGKKLFAEHHPDGDEYQKVLDIACEHDRPDFASWLLSKLGATVDVLTVDEIKTDKAVVFAGKIVAKFSIEAGGPIVTGGPIVAGGSIVADGPIEAGGSIETGGPIKAGGPIVAGSLIKADGPIEADWSIVAGSLIKAGYGFGIYAGLKAKLSDKSNRTVIAKIQPDNLMCGEFAPLEDSHED